MNRSHEVELARYNAADDLLRRHLTAERAQRTAYIDRDGSWSYRELERRVSRFASLLAAQGIGLEDRVLLCILDTIELPVCFLGAIRAGAVAIPVSTLLKPDDYRYMLADSRARALVVSAELYAGFRDHLREHRALRRVWVSGADGQGHERLRDALDGAPEDFETAPTRPDDVAFWLYTSGTTGRPKGVMHAQTSLCATAELYGRGVLGMRAEDVVFSAAKLFFAYGLGNALSFPLVTGATTVLLDGRPTPEAVKRVLDAHRPTLFFGVPTLYAMLLSSRSLPALTDSRLRLCVSAGEALPESVLARWREQVQIDILDGIGSTEMLHIFLSNSPGDVRPGSSGRVVPGYAVRLLNEAGAEVSEGEMGDLWVSGPSSALGYWNQRAKSAETFQGPWLRTGDKYRRDAEGHYVHCGRGDDMLKVGGIYVSPVEVESALAGHPAVVETAVVGAPDGDGLVKPRAYVVLAQGWAPSDELARALVEHVRATLAEFKRPRTIEFVDSLPRTATGKLQRYRLRAG